MKSSKGFWDMVLVLLVVKENLFWFVEREKRLKWRPLPLVMGELAAPLPFGLFEQFYFKENGFGPRQQQLEKIR